MSDKQTRVSPREIYHRVWELVPQLFWFQDRLADWAQWEHKFDDELATDADAMRCATIMLESLKDAYTEMVAEAPGENDNDADADNKPVCCAAEMLEGNIGYLKVSTFSNNKAAYQMRDAMLTMADASAYIVDLRGNTGGLLIHANHALATFLDKGGTYTLKERRISDGGYFESNCRLTPKRFRETVDYASKPSKTFIWHRPTNITGAKPLVVLVNGRTGSASELFAAVLRDHRRATLIGTPTAGKGIAQNKLTVGNGYKLIITDGVFLPPSGQFFGDHGQTVDNGIVPHITVQAVADEDSQMAAALDFLASRLGGSQPVERELIAA